MNRSGLAILDGLIAAAILIVITVVVASFVVVNTRQSRNIATATSCEQLASNIIFSVTSLDQSIFIRNSLATPATNRGLHDSQDPFCPSAGANGCDTVDHVPNFNVSLDPGMDGANINIYSAQNIRGAMSWAWATYNNRRPAICTTGEIYTLMIGPDPDFGARAALDALLPVPLTPDDRTEAVQIQIEREGNPGCPPLIVAPQSGLGLRFTVRVTYRQNYPEKKFCTDSAVVRYAADTVNNAIPNIRTLTVTGPVDLSLAPDAVGLPGVKCTCQRGGPFCGPGDIYAIQTVLAGSEPGSNFACRLTTDGVSSPIAPLLYYCSRPGLGIDLSLSSLLYNLPTTATAAVTFPPTGEHIYQLFGRSLDTSANLSVNEAASVPVVTRTPVCPDASGIACGLPVYDDCGAVCGVGASGCGPGPGPGAMGPCTPPQLAAGWEDDSGGNCCGPPPHWRLVGGTCYPSCGVVAGINGRGGSQFCPTGDHELTPPIHDCASYGPICGAILTAFPETSWEMVLGIGGECCAVDPL